MFNLTEQEIIELCRKHGCSRNQLDQFIKVEVEVEKKDKKPLLKKGK